MNDNKLPEDVLRELGFHQFYDLASGRLLQYTVAQNPPERFTFVKILLDDGTEIQVSRTTKHDL